MGATADQLDSILAGESNPHPNPPPTWGREKSDVLLQTRSLCRQTGHVFRSHRSLAGAVEPFVDPGAAVRGDLVRRHQQRLRRHRHRLPPAGRDVEAGELSQRPSAHNPPSLKLLWHLHILPARKENLRQRLSRCSPAILAQICRQNEAAFLHSSSNSLERLRKMCRCPSQSGGGSRWGKRAKTIWHRGAASPSLTSPRLGEGIFGGRSDTRSASGEGVGIPALHC